MSRALKICLSLLFLTMAAGVAAWAWFLSGRSLDDADKLSSVVGLVVSFPLAAASLVFAILAWRDGRATAPAGGSTFHVSAGRDAYTAEQMTFHQGTEGRADDGSPT